LSIFKRISDPVHGTVELTRVEVDLINTPAFQRLRNVKQLGLAHYVFPGADYSRFAHSVGVCHVTGKILDALKRVAPGQLKPKEIEKYRLAALLHDLGHYPYSHATEEAILNHYSASLLRSRTPARHHTSSILPRSFKHDRVSKEILLKDSLIREVLGDHSIKPEELSSIFLRENPPRFANLVRSDLDADRIDYLLRTAHHTGLPYGSVDIDYILSQICLDRENRICISAKALRAADHFLLCRYFDYQQVTYHKSVVGFELVLKDVISALLEAELIDCSAPTISKQIRSGSWNEFDDAFMLGKIRDLSRQTGDKNLKAKAISILNRFPPKLVAETELIQRRVGTHQDFLSRLQSVKEKVAGWATIFRLDKSLWRVWSTSMVLTKIGSSIPVSSIEEDNSNDRDRLDQAIMILSSDRRSSKSIMQVPHSLMSVLADFVCYTIRVYVLVPSNKKHLTDSIKAKVRKDLPNIDWK